ncbi:glycoside hydrolase family 3 C-terminal domain-containing protein [Alsobacter sp. SYSU M60028]|uniref:beta-glucosidase n=1 Tax=Alsobacter ponti TaxID=2962936 RepID=A0ABT1LHI4_9HYPH|nr:glycoside hydrolase family 3 N-terminal domain-containing protein [Alsobacter ponti]MCP8940972.1 glycoside hydrolase family 3 C-terminal domain-containing protein [Alsobacter ponti]
MNASGTRVEQLVAAMTLREKLAQLTMLSPLPPGAPRQPDLEAELRAGLGSILNVVGRERIDALQRIARRESRLGVPCLFSLDVVHGHRTIFPVPLGEMCAFDPGLWEATAAAAAREARRDGIALTFAPMLDVCRDPRWGRIAEGPGEDPWLASLFARAKVRGFQGADPASPGGPDRLGATAKHFVAYGAVTGGRDYNTVDISERALRSVYLPPFRAAVEEGVAAIMPAFIDLSGEPMTGSRALLTGLLRETWNFDGVLVSDYNAVAELVAHGVASDIPEAAALALNAGVDIDMVANAYVDGLEEAIGRGLVTTATVDDAVRRVLRLKERLGLFDDEAVPVVDTASPPRALALEAATRSIVMTRNAKGALPLAMEGGPIAVIGPLASSREDMLGPWSALGDMRDAVDLVSALRATFPTRRVDYAPGSRLESSDEPALDAALELAGAAETVVLCLGEVRDMSGEGASRATPVVPAAQVDLAMQVLALGRPTVLVLCSGRPLVATELYARVDAMLVTWFLGSEAGTAIARVLAGEASPSGRLPVSWPAAVGQIPIHYAELPVGRPASATDRFTSRYIDAPVRPLFAFGHGLAYTSFAIDEVTPARPAIGPQDGVVVTVRVRNTGPNAGRTAVLLFVHDPVARVARPVLELRGVAAAELAPGASATLSFALTPADLLPLGAEPGARPEPGRIEILAGFSADPAELKTASVTVVPG